ncbi:MAG: hypothetical protein WAT47_08930, partial [Nostocoides sp.]
AATPTTATPGTPTAASPTLASPTFGSAPAGPPSASPPTHGRPGPDLTAYEGYSDADLVSEEDEDLIDLGEVGQPVIERVLGGTVIWRESPDG